MANVNAPNGLLPVKGKNDSIATPNKYTVASGNVTPMAKGDLVLFGGLDCTQYIEAGGPIAVAGCIGVFDSCRYTNASGKLVFSTYLPASQAATIFVYDNPDQLFSVQCDAGGSTAISPTLIGLNFNMLNGTSAQAPTQIGPSGHSVMQIDTSSGVTTTVGTLRVLYMDDTVGNVISTTESESRYGRVIVKILNHFLVNSAPASGLAAGI